MSTPPDGYARIDITSGFAAEFGAIMVRRDGDRIWLGFRVDPSHLDAAGACSAGALATFADMQLAAWMRTGAFPIRHCPTLSLSLDVMAPARSGDWVEAEVQLLSSAGRRVFTQAVMRVGDAPIVRSSAIYAFGSAKAAAAPLPAERPSAPAALQAPTGFQPLDIGGGFAARFGPIFARVDDEGAKLGFFVAQTHVNIWGFCHGGALATFAHAQRETPRLTGAASGPVETVSFAIHYLAPARGGDWVECEVALVKRTRRFLFTQALLKSAGEPISRSTAIFALSDS